MPSGRCLWGFSISRGCRGRGGIWFYLVASGSLFSPGFLCCRPISNELIRKEASVIHIHGSSWEPISESKVFEYEQHTHLPGENGKFAWSLFFMDIYAFNKYTNFKCSVTFPTNLLIQALVSFLSSSVVWGWHNCPPRAPLGEHSAKTLPPPGKICQWIWFVHVKGKFLSVQMEGNWSLDFWLFSTFQAS